ncbi:hypothetical protein AVEN_216569-1 [Araneus ventricosus]|uniref:Uncharacterized protein n=1 Tax=Araneus ventricosus TaxID=182803 RepID=A0A4Y2G2G2_ARAVE|nr:hypothetical protein AVEN_216569-1 [Araneus ventricosus]
MYLLQEGLDREAVFGIRTRPQYSFLLQRPSFRNSRMPRQVGVTVLMVTYDLTCNRPIYREDIQWNRVTNMEPSSPEAESLPLGHCCPQTTSLT